ncbi:UNVERIFIED_CONTAM: hypothetical protein HDU68_010452 [Siphonaria sp. JEL0065]|nr:hypothetical protein HDU68_010452 [Siphonaria sp. JEL0065]
MKLSESLVAIIASSGLVSAFGATCAKDLSAKYIAHLKDSLPVDIESLIPASCSKNCVPYLPRISTPPKSSASGLQKKKQKGTPGKGKKGGKKPHKNREKGDVSDLKVAIGADFGLGKHPSKVLKMIDDWGAELTLMTGDYDYVDSPDAFLDLIDSEVGPDFPFIGVVGNHDITEWYGRGGYRDRFLERLGKIEDISCYGEYGANMICTWRGMVFSLSGVGSLGQNHAQFIDLSLENYKEVPWKICAWHKNQKAYQTGDKENETGYEVYETCRKHGAIVATSHEHSYERTHLMSSFEEEKISSTNNTLNIRPGETFAFVSGLGGESMRKWYKKAEKNPWWASTVSQDNKGNYGALLCTFNKHNVLQLAHCKFKDIDGKKWDDFWIYTDPNNPSESFKKYNTKPRVSLVEVGVTKPADVMTLNRITGETSCGSHRLKLANSTSNSFIHTLRYEIPKSAFDYERGDILRGARLQVMGSHAESWVVGAGGKKDSFTSNVVALRIGSASPESVDSFSNFCSHQPQSAALLQQDTSDSDILANQHQNAMSMSKTFVEWSQEGEGWEAGEVWVSPDISPVVMDGIDSLSRLLLVVDGSSSLDKEIRSVYGVHEREIGMCVSPTLVLEVEKGIRFF